MGQRFVLRRLLSRSNAWARELYDGLLAYTPARRAKERQVATLRARGLEELLNFTDALKNGDAPCHRILVDGLWDNANYWIRFRMLCAALSIDAESVTGLLGKFSRSAVKDTFSTIGVSRLIDYYGLSRAGKTFHAEALILVKSCRTPDDILAWKLPLGIPPETFFDAILKRQRRATVDLGDPLIVDYVAEGLAYAAAAERILSEAPYDLLVLSHALNFELTALVFGAIRQGIPVLVLYGDYGTLRPIRIATERDYFAYPSRPTLSEVANLSPLQHARLADAGAQYLSARLGGKTTDISAIYAYQRPRDSVTREEICAKFGWDPTRPLVGVYASNWFDFPHCSGLKTFRDFLEWIETTIASVKGANDINWLFRNHPCDDWYGGTKGITLAHLVKQANSPNIKLAPGNWNGADLMTVLDGVITCHGTIGIEAAFMGTPVLTASQSWYSGGRFTVQAEDRDHYCALLHRHWWENWDREGTKERAALYAGWYFAMPSWHGRYVFPDDSRQDENYAQLPDFLDAHAPELAREIDLMRTWFNSGHTYYHIYKNALADDFVPCIPVP